MKLPELGPDPIPRNHGEPLDGDTQDAIFSFSLIGCVLLGVAAIGMILLAIFR